MSSPAFYKFRLYVAGEAQNSMQARTNLSAMCREYLAGRFEIDVVDVFRESGRAFSDGILLTPTLVKLEPGLQQRIVGNLSQTSVVLEALGLPPHTA